MVIVFDREMETLDGCRCMAPSPANGLPHLHSSPHLSLSFFQILVYSELEPPLAHSNVLCCFYICSALWFFLPPSTHSSFLVTIPPHLFSRVVLFFGCFFFFNFSCNLCNLAFSELPAVKTKPVLPKGHAVNTLYQIIYLVPPNCFLASDRNIDYLLNIEYWICTEITIFVNDLVLFH